MKQIRSSVCAQRILVRTLAVLAVAGGVAISPLHAAGGSEADTAPALLFDSPYLASMTPPAELAYRFEHETTDEENYGKAFADDVRIGLQPPAENHKLNSVTLDIFSDSRSRQIGPLSDVTGNPVIMVFLERDVFQMKRRVQGSPALFRNTIRKALRDSATVEDVDIEYAGRTVAAKRVTIMPFDGDRIPVQFAEFRNKAYHFTVSEEVPGGFFEIVSLLPDPENGDRTLVSDRMVFTSTSEK